MRRIVAIAAALISAVLAAAPAAGSPSVLAKLPAGGDARDVARDAGVTLARAFPAIRWAEFELPGGDPARARERLLDDPRVFRLDWQRRGDVLETQVVPDDTFTASPGTIGGASTDWPWRQARFITAWDIGRGSAATRVAVLDSEIDTQHPDLAAKVAGAYNAERQTAAYGSADVRASGDQIAEANASPDDNDLHGSHVAGLAGAATGNGQGVSGAGYDIALLPVKVTLTVPSGVGDALFVGNVVDGIVWATGAGARVINMSFGTGTNHPALADAVEYAASRDVLPVAAAGNNQMSAPGVPLYPAALPQVLAVGALTPSGTIAPFSTNGDYVDVAAPGVQILSTWDTRAPGQPLSGGGRLPGYFALSGTSMASPIVAGLAGLVRDLRPDITAEQTKGLIEATAVDAGPPGRDVQYGAGLIDADAAMRAAAAFAPPQPPPAPPAPPTGPGPQQAPLRTAARLRYRCAAGATEVPTGTRVAVRRGARLLCRGSTLPALRRTRLQVQRLVKGRWVRVGTAVTTSEGRFRFAVGLRSLGRWAIRAAVAASASHAASAGPRARLTVLRRR